MRRKMPRADENRNNPNTSQQLPTTIGELNAMIGRLQSTVQELQSTNATLTASNRALMTEIKELKQENRDFENNVKRAEREEKQRIQQQMLSALGRQALTEPDLDALLQDAAQRVVDTLGMEFCKILELLPDHQQFRLRAGVGWKNGLVGSALVPADNHSQAGYTLQVMEPVVVSDIRKESRFYGPVLLRNHGVRSGITVAILAPDGRPFGMLGVHSRTPRTYETYDVDFLQSVANTLAAAIIQHRTTVQLQQSEERLRLGVTLAGMAVADIDYRADTIHLGANAAAIFGLGTEAATLPRVRIHELFHPADRVELMEKINASFAPYGTGEFSMTHRIIRPDGAVRWLHVSKKVFFTSSEHGPAQPTHGILVVHDITAQKIQEQTLAFLANLGHSLNAATTTAELLHTSTRLVSDYFPGIRCRLIDLDRSAQSMTVLTGHLLDESQPSSLLPMSFHTDFAEGFWPRLHAGETIVINDVEQATFTSDHAERLREQQLKTLIIVPILRDGNPVALLTAFSYAAYSWSAEEVTLLETISERLWLGLERLRLIEALQASEVLAQRHLGELEAIYNTAPIGLCVMDRDLRYVRINERLAQMNGLPASEHIGRTGREVLPDLAAETEPKLRRVVETGEPLIGIELTGEIPSQPGVQHTWVESWLPLFDEAGEVTAINIVIQDITDRKATEAEARFQAAILHQINDAVIAVDTEERVTYLNVAAAKLYRVDRNAALGQPLTSLYTYSWRSAEDERQARQQLARDGYWRGENIHVRQDGVQLLMELSLHTLRHEDGERLGTFAVMRDVTERKAAEDALRRSEERYRFLFENMDDGFCIIEVLFDDADTPYDYRFVEANPSFERHTGLVNAIGKTIRTLVPGLEDHWLQLYGEIAQSGVPKRFEQGSAVMGRWFDVYAFYAGNGAERRVAIFFRDITDRKMAEDALQALTSTLEERVVERTAELERSNRELDQFAYIASHDLRAPLRGINHLVNWIREDAGKLLPPESQNHFVTLQGRVQRMEQLLEDLLIYSRVGRQPTQVEEVDTHMLVARLVELLQPHSPFHITIDEEMPVFRTRRVPLELVLRNLIDNAIKHHDREDGHVHIGAQERARWIEFTVQDDGPGIDPMYHDRIFQIFQTLQPRDQVEGSGMGLAVVKKTVETMGGKIQVDSTEGNGAIFRFTWPK